MADESEDGGARTRLANREPKGLSYALLQQTGFGRLRSDADVGVRRLLRTGGLRLLG
jgi:hypothetical protein